MGKEHNVPTMYDFSDKRWKVQSSSGKMGEERNVPTM